jgi:hypothetical protein
VHTVLFAISSVIERPLGQMTHVDLSARSATSRTSSTGAGTVVPALLVSADAHPSGRFVRF